MKFPPLEWVGKMMLLGVVPVRWTPFVPFLYVAVVFFNSGWEIQQHLLFHKMYVLSFHFFLSVLPTIWMVAQQLRWYIIHIFLCPNLQTSSWQHCILQTHNLSCVASLSADTANFPLWFQNYNICWKTCQTCHEISTSLLGGVKLPEYEIAPCNNM